MNYEWIGIIIKKKIRKKTKNLKTTVKLPIVNKKPVVRKLIFAQTPFSRTILNLEWKFRPQDHLFFDSFFRYSVTKFTTPICLQKSQKYLESSIKRQRQI